MGRQRQQQGRGVGQVALRRRGQGVGSRGGQKTEGVGGAQAATSGWPGLTDLAKISTHLFSSGCRVSGSVLLRSKWLWMAARSYTWRQGDSQGRQGACDTRCVLRCRQQGVRVPAAWLRLRGSQRMAWPCRLRNEHPWLTWPALVSTGSMKGARVSGHTCTSEGGEFRACCCPTQLAAEHAFQRPRSNMTPSAAAAAAAPAPLGR